MKAFVECPRGVDMAAIIAALPGATDHWWADGGMHVVGVTQAALEAAAAMVGTEPRAPVPLSVPLWRARAALAEAGLLGAVNAAIAAQGGPVSEWWEYGVEVERAHPRIAEIAAALGLTSAQIDSLFRRAAVIEP